MLDRKVAVAFGLGALFGAGVCFVYDRFFRKKETEIVTKYITSTPDSEADIDIPKEQEVQKTQKKEPVYYDGNNFDRVYDVYHKVLSMPSNEPTEHPGNSESDLAEGIHEITPDEFAYDNYYSKVTLKWFMKDGILIDEYNEEVELLSDTISSSGPDCIGHYIPDVAYIRNDNLHIDYEVIADERSYHEIRGVDEGTFIS